MGGSHSFFGRRNLSDFQFKLLVGQEYELEHKLHGGDRRSKTFEEKSKAQNEPLKSTAEKIAEEHGVSRETVKRSADLYNSVKIIGDVAPSVGFRLMDSHEKEYLKAMLHHQLFWWWTRNAAKREKRSLDTSFDHRRRLLLLVAFQPIDRPKSNTHG